MAKSGKKKDSQRDLEDRIVSRIATLLELNVEPAPPSGDVEVHIAGTCVAAGTVQSLSNDKGLDQLIAIAHPIRLRMCLAAVTPVRATTLLEELQLGTTGQVYHHLRILTEAGWLDNTDAGYLLPNDRHQRLLGILALLDGE